MSKQHQPTSTQAAAIPGETVASIRKYLNKTKLLFDNRYETDFDLSADISQGDNPYYSVQQFCFDFVRGNHIKRQERHRNRKNS